MNLRRLTVHNYGPYLGRREVHFTPSDDGIARPICLIGALNGSGKTSLLDALLLALYGPRARCSTRGNEAYADFLRASINHRVPATDGAEVALEFEHHTPAGSTTLEVIRRWRDTGKRINEETIVLRDGERDPALAETWTEHVEGLIPLGISNLFFFDGEQVRELATNDDTPQSVRDAIRTLLGLEIPTRLQADLTIVANRRRKQIADPTGLAEVRRLEAEVKSARTARRNVVHDLGALQNELDRAERELEAANSRFVSEGGELAQKRHELERDLSALKGRRHAIRDAMRDVASGPLGLALAPKLVESAMARARAEAEHAEGLRSLELLTRRDETLLSHLAAAGHDDLLAEVRSFLQDDRANRQKPMEPEPYLAVTTDSLGGFEQTVGHQLPENAERSSALMASLLQVEEQIARVEAQIQKSAPPEMLERQLGLIHEARDQVEVLRSRRDALEQDKEEATTRLRELEETLQRTLTKITEERQSRDDHNRVIRSAERVQQVLEEYCSKLLARKLHDLERLVAERFRHLSRKTRFVDRVEIDGETFALSLFDDEGAPIDKRRMSAGEQQLLAVSFLWALALASGRSLPVVIDTPLSRMDSKHRDKLVERYFPHASHQVVLLSTDVEIDEPYFQKLKGLDAIDQSFRIQYDPQQRSSTIERGYFW